MSTGQGVNVDIEKQLDRLPDKTYFRIGEVAEITGVEPYVLRFWETEFKSMVPPKSRSKQRMYRKKDIGTVLRIKELLYKERFTIEGARKQLAAARRASASGADGAGLSGVPARELHKLRRELRDIRQLLDDA